MYYDKCMNRENNVKLLSKNKLCIMCRNARPTYYNTLVWCLQELVTKYRKWKSINKKIKSQDGSIKKPVRFLSEKCDMKMYIMCIYSIL